MMRPNTLHTFIRKTDGAIDTGLLPSIGESNSFADWNKDKRAPLGGWWKSRKFKNELQNTSAKKARKGLGQKGLLSRFVRIIGQSRYDCKRRKSGLPISDSPQKMLEVWEKQKSLCVCGISLSVLEAHADHDHKTGKVRAFLHPTCNVIEGLLNNKTELEVKNLLAWFWSQQ